jgi:hypothetical protein
MGNGMRFLKKRTFWGGFIVGTVVGPLILTKFAPGVKAKIPG